MAVTTIVSSGLVRERAPVLIAGFSGGSLSIADVEIDERLMYAQHSDRHLVHATLDRTWRAARRGSSSDRRGAFSFTPAGQDRNGAVERGRIVGAEISFDAAFIAAACEQASSADWRRAFNERDDKAFALAECLGAACRRQATPLTCDMLALALARRLGSIYGACARRRDDGWLHPWALMRVVERLRCDPVHLSLADLAQEAGLGVSAFVRAFRGSLGKTPIAFALDLRLEMAANALHADDQSLSEIAALAGFSSASHLVRIFHARRGKTPGRWRQEAASLTVSQRPDVTKSAQTTTPLS